MSSFSLRSRYPSIIFLLIVFEGVLSAAQAQEGATFFRDGFESEDVCRWSRSSSSVDECPPIFPGVVLAIPHDETSLLVSWLPAIDDQTDGADLRYRLHLGAEAGFEPSAATLLVTVVGGTEVRFTGLEPGTEGFLLILVEDEQGSSSRERDYVPVSMPAFAVEFDPETPIEKASLLGLGRPLVVEPNRLVFPLETGASFPTIGAVLFGQVTDEEAYLRRVETVTEVGQTLEVLTEPGSLGAAVTRMDFSSVATVVSVPSPETDPSMSSTRLEDGSSVRRWSGRSVSIEEVRHAVDRADGSTGRPIPGSRNGVTSISLGDDLLLQLDASFSPRLITQATWTLGGIESAELIAEGELRLSALAEYAFEASATYAPEPFPLFTKRWTSFYTVGGVPVLQKVTVKVSAEVRATAAAAVNASVQADRTVTARLGVTYDSASGWTPVSSLDDRRSLRTNLSLEGTASAEVHLKPEVEVKFYEVVAGRLSLDASLSGSVRAVGTTAPTCAPLMLDAFDVDAGLDCPVGIDFSLPFGPTFTVWEGSVCSSSWNLFGLSTVQLVASGLDPVEIRADVTGGTANPFEHTSALWRVEPSTATVSATSTIPPS